MSDLVEQEVPASITLASATITKENVDAVPAAGLRVLTSSSERSHCGVGMVGYAFMGAAHSQAWRTAGRVLRPAAAAATWPCSAGATRRRPPRRRRRSSGWRSVETDWKQLLSRDDVAAGRRLHARRHARRDRHRRAGRRQARAVREAAGQHRRRGARDGRRGRAGRGRPGCAAWSASTTAGCRRWRWPGGWWPRAGSAQIRHVRAQYLQDWIVDPEFPLVWRLQAEKAGSGALGDIGAHIVDMAQFVIGDRLTGVSGAHRDVRAGAAAARGVERAVRVAAAPSAATGHRRRRGAVPRPLRRRGGGVASRPPGSPPAARTRSGWRSTAARGSLAFDFESMNELSFYDGAEDPDTAGLPPHPGHRADPPVRGRLVAAGAPARLRALVHPRGRGPGHATSARTATRCRRSPTACRCSWCWTPSTRSAAAGSGWQPSTS